MKLGLLLFPLCAAAQGGPPPPPPAPDPALLPRKIEELEERLVKSDAKLQEATTAFESAKRAAEAASKNVSNVRADFEAARSGRLISAGLTGGVAVAVQIPLLISIDRSRQESVNTAAMPYVVAIPMYWTSGEATRAYCAVLWESGKEAEAQKAARAVAHERAGVVFEAATATLRTGATAEWVADHFFGAIIRLLAIDLAKAIETWAADTTTPAAGRTRTRQDLVRRIASHDWNEAETGKCALRKVGVWVGRPFAYEALSRLQGREREEREFVPVVAAGFAIVPNPYFSFLGGVTAGALQPTREEVAILKPALLLVPTIAVGGNLDLVTSLFR